MRQDGDDATSNKSTAAQVLEASTLLQQQGGGELGGVSGVIPSITAELIAQCFLNLPNSINNSSSSLGSEPGIDDDESQADGDDVESVAMANDAAVSAANILAALGETLSEGKFYPYKNYKRNFLAQAAKPLTIRFTFLQVYILVLGQGKFYTQ